MRLQRCHFVRIVGDQADRGYVEQLKDTRREFEAPAVRRVPQFEVRFDGVEAFILKFVRLQLRHQSDSPALLILVEQNARASFRDHAEGEFKLLSAIAAEGVEYIAGQALGVNSNDGRGRVDVAHNEGDR